MIRSDGKQLGVIPEVVSVFDPRWSPNGRSLAFEGAGNAIELLPTLNSVAHELTQPPPPPPGQVLGASDSEPSWFSDGKRLLFVRVTPDPATNDPVTAIWSISVDGSGAKQLLASTPPGSATPAPNVIEPEVSPDGRQLAFADIYDELWIANADGSGRRRLGSTTNQGEEPRWSPDGRRIAYLDPDAERLRILDVGSGAVRTLALKGVLQSAHAWSPDGRWLAVGRSVEYSCVDPTNNNLCPVTELWIVNAFDGRKRRIVRMSGEIDGLDWRR
jgi:Tol biopolymer transport system component